MPPPLPPFVISIPSSIPDNIEKSIKKIGSVIDLSATSALYAPHHQSTAFSNTKVMRDIHYDAHERNLLDICADSKNQLSKPVLVFVHGGGFVGGNKSGPSTPFYDNILLWAAQHGMVGVNVTYRLAPQYQWPSAQEDLFRAIEWIVNNIAYYGGDPSKIFLAGHSAGAAHVAQYIALYNASIKKKTSLSGLMLVSGIFNPSSFSEQAMVQSYFGTNAALMAQKNSVLALVQSEIPMLFSYAEFDPPAFVAQTLEAAYELQQANYSMQCIKLIGHNHLSSVYAIGTKDRKLSDAWLDFMKQN